MFYHAETDQYFPNKQKAQQELKIMGAPLIPVEIEEEPKPDFDPLTQRLVRHDELIGPKRVISYTLENLTEAEQLEALPWKDYPTARKAVVEWINNLTSQIMDMYPAAVQKRWEIEEAAAEAVLHDAGEPNVNDHIATPAQIRLVTDEGATKGRTPEEHAQAIITNATKFRAIADETNKLFLATDKALQDATSPLEYPTIFEEAKTQAAPLAAAYGLELA